MSPFLGVVITFVTRSHCQQVKSHFHSTKKAECSPPNSIILLKILPAEFIQAYRPALSVSAFNHNREQRRRQRERHKIIALMSKNNCSTRAFYVFVHFFAVISKTTTWNDQIQGFLKNVSTWRLIFHFPSLLERRSHKFSSRILRPHCTNWTNWNNLEVVEVSRSYIFKWRFRCRRRCRC